MREIAPRPESMDMHGVLGPMSTYIASSNREDLHPKKPRRKRIKGFRHKGAKSGRYRRDPADVGDHEYR